MVMADPGVRCQLSALAGRRACTRSTAGDGRGVLCGCVLAVLSIWGGRRVGSVLGSRDIDIRGSRGLGMVHNRKRYGYGGQ
jgi:hypothetical protein